MQTYIEVVSGYFGSKNGYQKVIMCLKENRLRALNYDNHSRLEIKDDWGRRGCIWPFNEHKILHFDNGEDIHMSFENDEECGSNLDLDLLTISY